MGKGGRLLSKLPSVVALVGGTAPVSPWRTACQLARRRPMVVGRRFRIRGARNITAVHGFVALGVNSYGFLDRSVSSLLNVQGTLLLDGRIAITGGNRWDIGKGASMQVKGPATFSPFTRVVVTDSLTIGGSAMVGWDVQMIDSDFHPTRMSDDGPFTYSETGISIGEHVWIASRATVLAGTTIADGCIVAAGSVVRGHFTEPNCLIGGIPAKVVKRSVAWTDPGLVNDATIVSA